jgi:hypothetical protein
LMASVILNLKPGYEVAGSTARLRTLYPGVGLSQG